MNANYLWLKGLHVLLALIALGTSAGLGIVLEFYGDERTHGSFVLRVIERMITLVVLPGYILVLATGAWMVSLAWPLSATWIQLALGLWFVGLVLLGCSLAALRRQRRLHPIGGRPLTLAAFATRALGAAFGLVAVGILYLMVFKPS